MDEPPFWYLYIFNAIIEKVKIDWTKIDVSHKFLFGVNKGELVTSNAMDSKCRQIKTIIQLST